MVVVELVGFLLSVAYLIVLERKGLGMAQLRIGPNKVSLKGLLQPVADGVKLFLKEVRYTFSTTFFGFVVGPFFLFFLAFCLWVITPSQNFIGRLEYGLLFFLALSRCNVYGVFLCGWCCNSRYAMLGAMRGAAQVVSYEVVLSTILFCPLIVVKSFDLVDFRESWQSRTFI
jgi:NADH-quinone oxidoreductase subunit H